MWANDMLIAYHVGNSCLDMTRGVHGEFQYSHAGSPGTCLAHFKTALADFHYSPPFAPCSSSLAHFSRAW